MLMQQKNSRELATNLYHFGKFLSCVYVGVLNLTDCTHTVSPLRGALLFLTLASMFNYSFWHIRTSHFIQSTVVLIVWLIL